MTPPNGEKITLGAEVATLAVVEGAGAVAVKGAADAEAAKRAAFVENLANAGASDDPDELFNS